MAKNKEESAVLTRLEAAIALHKSEHPEQPICISELCRKAGVNRSNLYANHPQLLAKMRKDVAEERPKVSVQKRGFSSESVELAQLRTQNKALLYLCLELRASVDDLEMRYSQMRSKSKSRGGK